MTDAEWRTCLQRLDENEQDLLAREPEAPNLAAARCVDSKHRTLAHLRACQETWLEAALAFHQRPNSRIKLLHPWRLFEKNSYELVPWEDHLAAFRADRLRWKELLATADRSTSGKMNEKPFTIEDLTSRLVAHEHYHIHSPR